MTTNRKIERLTDSAAWLQRKVAQLGAALERLPPPLQRKVAQLGAALQRLPPHRRDLAPLEDPQSKTASNQTL